MQNENDVLQLTAQTVYSMSTSTPGFYNTTNTLSNLSIYDSKQAPSPASQLTKHPPNDRKKRPREFLKRGVEVDTRVPQHKVPEGDKR